MDQLKLTRTKTQLKNLGYPRIGIQLKDGTKHFGIVDKFTPHTIYFKNRHGDVIDVPRKYIRRAMIIIDGDQSKDGS